MNMKLIRTIRIQLKPTLEQASLLQQTMHEYTACFNEVCQIADTEKISNGVELHRLTYANQRATTHLPSQLICAARVKATEALKSVIARRKKQVQKHQQRLKEARKTGKPVKPLKLAQPPHSKLCAIRYDARSFRVDRDSRMVSLVHVQQEGHIRNRATITVKVPAYYEQYLTQEWHQDSADLLYRKGSYWLHMVVSCEQSAIPSTPESKVIGGDLGINRLAVTSHPRFFAGKRIKETNNRYFRLRRSLQAKGTKSAKRHLKKLSGKLKRFQADANHKTAKRIVSSCQPGDTLVMENLTDIRERTKGRRKQRRAMSNWSFSQLQSFIAYKAAYKGVAVRFVDARYSSQACSKCGYSDKRNRVCQSEFSCKNKQCGYQLNADYNAALNLASRARSVASGLSVKQAIVSTLRSQGQASCL